MVNNWESFRANLCWQVGNGEDIHFWQDNWRPNGNKLSLYSLVPVSKEDTKLAISHFTTYSGEWNWGLIENIIPESVISDLAKSPSFSP